MLTLMFMLVLMLMSQCKPRLSGFILLMFLLMSGVFSLVMLMLCLCAFENQPFVFLVLMFMLMRK